MWTEDMIGGKLLLKLVEISNNYVLGAEAGVII